MNYYQRHIGDYIKDAGHLSLLEHGVFARLLDVYYGREAPIPDDQKYRLIMARTDEEKATVDAILIEFFKRDGDAWSNKRCDEEIFRAQEKSRKAAESAGARWDNSERNADAMPTQCEGNAPISHKPITNNQVTNPPTPQGGLENLVEEKPKRKRQVTDHAEGIPIPERLQKVQGFEKAWGLRCAQRFAVPKTRFPTPASVEAELGILLKCSDPVAVLNNAIAGGWQGLNAKKWDFGGPDDGLQLVPGGKDPIGPTVGLYDPAGTQVYVPESDQDRLLAEGWTTHPPPKEKPKVRGDLKSLEEKVAWQ